MPLKDARHVTVLLPSVSLADLSQPGFQTSLKFLNNGTKRSLNLSTQQIYAELFNYSSEKSLPAAALLADYFGLDVKNSHWLVAELVQLQLDATAVYMIGSDKITLTDAEALEIFDVLKAHFALDDMQLHKVNSKYFLLQEKQASKGKCIQNLESISPEDLKGKNLTDYLPEGEWHRVFAEVQMLLERTETNQLRRSWGKPTVDATWFWGAGLLPTNNESPWKLVLADNDLLAALAKHHGCNYENIKQLGHDIVKYANDYPCLISNDNSTLKQLSDFVEQCQEALKNKTIDSMSFVIANEIECFITAADLKPWWKLF